MLKIERFETKAGIRIYRIPMVVFPNGFVGYSYVILNAGRPTLVDAGSGFDMSNDHLLKGIAAIRDDFGENFQLTDIEHLIITHGHMDHFGGAAFIVEKTGAQVGIHELDRRVLTNYEERVIVATKDLRIYLERAGVPEEKRRIMIEMYGFAKKHVKSLKVDFSIDEDVMFEGMQFVHVPGHCPGQVCIILGEVMITADHILPKTTPHQAPESITHYTGLGHYRDSLRKIAKIDGIELGLGGHETPIHDIYARIEEIMHSHDRKLNRVLDIIKNFERPCTIHEITQAMYPNKDGYEILLALEEAGAHIEYLYQHGMLSVANLDEIERENNPPLKYVVS
ncbi:MAG: MBL fold metallo-hydrolase [Chloroflexi bacterium]|nr:MAG: MBL fold metallo-hydrolase [Chloroflexota bacterium]